MVRGDNYITGHMQIDLYINIPTIESTTSTHNYLSYTEILVSLLTGIRIYN